MASLLESFLHSGVIELVTYSNIEKRSMSGLTTTLVISYKLVGRLFRGREIIMELPYFQLAFGSFHEGIHLYLVIDVSTLWLMMGRYYWLYDSYSYLWPSKQSKLALQMHVYIILS